MKRWESTGPKDRPEIMALRIGKVLIAVRRMAGDRWRVEYHIEGMGSTQSYTVDGDAKSARADAEKKIRAWLKAIVGDAGEALKVLG